MVIPCTSEKALPAMLEACTSFGSALLNLTPFSGLA